jgi:hypothetical protein
MNIPFPNSLCAHCQHLRCTENKRGSVFMMCGLAQTDGRFGKYPPQPVWKCGGYVAMEGGAKAAE